MKRSDFINCQNLIHDFEIQDNRDSSVFNEKIIHDEKNEFIISNKKNDYFEDNHNFNIF